MQSCVSSPRPASSLAAAADDGFTIGAVEMHDMKLTDQTAGREIAGHENAGHEENSFAHHHHHHHHHHHYHFPM